MHVVALVAGKPDKSVGPVRLERDLDALAHVSPQVVLGHLAEDVQPPLVALEPDPARVGPLGRRRGRRRRGRRRARPVYDDPAWTRRPQYQIQQVHVARQSVAGH